MAHVQPKSAHGLERKKEFKLAEQANIAKENRTRQEERATEANVTPTAVDEGGSWQFKFVLGVIGAGVLLLMLKAIGLF